MSSVPHHVQCQPPKILGVVNLATSDATPPIHGSIHLPLYSPDIEDDDDDDDRDDDQRDAAGASGLEGTPSGTLASLSVTSLRCSRDGHRIAAR